MKYRLTGIVFGGLFLFLAHSAFAATGFLTEPLSIYPENPKDGDTVALTATLQNAETEDLRGAVSFYDGSILLGKKDITIHPGTIGTASISFAVNAGSHSFSANMGSMTTVSNGGTTEPLPVAIAKVTLPDLYVTKDTSAFGAQAIGLKASAQAAPILDKVGELQNKVVESVPASVKDNVNTTKSTVESWRTSNADSLAKATESAQKELDVIQKRAEQEAKKTGKPSASTRYIDSPLAYIKLFFLTMLSYMYGHPNVFYSVIGVFSFLVLRSLILRIVAYIKRRRAAARLARMPKAPRV